MNREQFTMDHAMQYQKDHLLKWKGLLKPKVFAKVKAKVEERNAKGYRTPYDVCRGTDIDNIIANLHLG